jgi:hypothetical protein
MLKIYLYFVSKTKEPDTWDNQFSNFLYRMLLQVTGTKISFYSNFSITECEQVSVDKVNCNDYDAVVVILHEKEYIEWSDDAIAFVFRRAMETQIAKFFLVKKFAMQEHIRSEILGRLSQYPFYEFNHHTLQYLEYKADKRGESEDGFWTKLSDLSFDVKYIANRTQTGEERLTTDIYLAEVSKDQVKNRDRIKRELILAGYNVLPHYPLPRNKDDFEHAVIELLSKSFLTVHILGELYGDSPEDVDYSYSEIQNRVFEAYYKQHKTDNPENNIRRIIWLPPVIEFYEDKQSQYIKRLRKEQLSKTNSEMVQCSIAELRTIIDKAYFGATSAAKNAGIAETGASRFLVIADSDVYNNAISELLTSQNLTFDIFGGNNTTVDELTETLKRYKHFVVINNNNHASWVNSMVSYIIRSKGYPNAAQDTKVGIFSTLKTISNNNFDALPASIHQYHINQTNIMDQLKLHISKLEL